MLLQLLNCYFDVVLKKYYFSYIREIHLLPDKIKLDIENEITKNAFSK